MPGACTFSLGPKVLQAVDSIDHSGIWEGWRQTGNEIHSDEQSRVSHSCTGLRARMDTTQSMRSSVDFPQSLRPLSLTGVSSESLEQLGRPGSDMLLLCFFRELLHGFSLLRFRLRIQCGIDMTFSAFASH